MVSAGYSQSVRYGNETTYGSQAATDLDLGAVQSIAPSESNNLIKIRTLGGNRDYKTVIPGKFEISGSMEYYYQGGAFLRQCIGEDSASCATVDSGGRYIATASYLHVMGSANSPGVNSYPSFSLEFTDYEDSGAASNTANLKRTYAGCRVNTLTLSATVDDPLTCSVDWLAKRVNVSTGAATGYTEYTEDPYVFYEGYIYLTTGVPTAGSPQSVFKDDAVCTILNFDLSVNNNCEAGWYIAGTCSTTDSARAAKYIIPKGRDYELSLGMHYQNKDMYERFLGSAGATSDTRGIDKFQVVMDFVKEGKVGSTGTHTRYLRMVVSSALFNDIAINGAPEDIVTNDVTVFTKKIKFYTVDADSDYSS